MIRVETITKTMSGRIRPIWDFYNKSGEMARVTVTHFAIKVSFKILIFGPNSSFRYRKVAGGGGGVWVYTLLEWVKLRENID